MSLKQSLKEAKHYIEVNDPESALEAIQEALEYDPDNYFAHIFQGKLYQLLNDFPHATQAFKKSIQLQPDNLLGWKGYFQIAKFSEDYDLFFAVLGDYLTKLIAQSIPAGDAINDAKNYLQQHSYKQNTQLYEKFLRLLLPDTVLGEVNASCSYVFLPLAQVYTQLVALVSKRQKDNVTSVVSKEKLRLPRNLLPEHISVLNAVKWNIYRVSDLDLLLEQAVNVVDDDDTRTALSHQLLDYKYELLTCCPPASNARYQADIRELVEGQVIIKNASLLCWTLYFDWMDAKSLSGEFLDLNVIAQFLKAFPTLGLAMVLHAFIMSDISPFDSTRVATLLLSPDANAATNETNQSLGLSPGAGEADSEADNLALLSLEDNVDSIAATAAVMSSPKQTLSILLKGFQKCTTSIFASRIICIYFIYLREYEEGSLKCRSAIQLLATLQRSTGVDLINTREDILCSLAIIYTYYEAPKNFGKALQLYDRILTDNKANVNAIVGKSLILIEKNQLVEARGHLENVVSLYPDNVQALLELNWCLIKMGEWKVGREGLLRTLTLAVGTDVHSSETRAIILWRIAKAYHKEELYEEEFGTLIKSLKESKNYAPSYTTLGVLYEEQYGDKVRAQKCFYKAFELDVGEIVAARYLVAELAKNDEWEVAEILCKRIVTTERSRRMLLDDTYDDEANIDKSWAYRVLGCAALNRQEDDKAVEWFQTALRMKSMDIQCWIGLGEAYYNCGRYDAAARVLRHTLTLSDGLEPSAWVVQYMLGVVLTEMGIFETAEQHLLAARELRPQEECVIHALYQCMINSATNLVTGGFFSRAIDLSIKSVGVISEGAKINNKSQVLWKELGDCIRIFNIIKERDVPVDEILLIIQSVEIDNNNTFMEEFRLLDGICESEVATISNSDLRVVVLGILAAKAGIYVLQTKSNKLLRSMCYFNLGLAYLEAYKACGEHNQNFRECSIKALKKSIQLEGSNATYWVTLGNAYSSSNPQVAQHCFIKATALESRDGEIWTNLAALYLRYGDHQLAEEAFLRALSVAPQQLQSWVGHALLAQAGGRQDDSFRLFNHAYILANGRSSLAQLLYGLSIITKRLHSGVDQRDIQASQEFSIANFAMNSYLKYSPNDELGLGIAMVISERCQDYDRGIEIGNNLISILEAKYEEDESDTNMLSFARAKVQVARMHLGVGQFDKALDAASLGLNVIGSDVDASEEYLPLVLSARITIGLGFFFNDQFEDALEQLKIILAKRADSQRLVTLIAQILYTYNTEETKQAALDQLFAFIEENGSSLLVVLTLGAISVVDDLDDYLGAIKEELQGLSLAELIGDRIRIVPQLISEINKRLGGSVQNDYIWQRNAILFPHDYHVWDKLSSDMAIRVAQLSDTKLNAGDTSDAYLKTGTLRSIQRSLLINPESSRAREGLVGCMQ